MNINLVFLDDKYDSSFTCCFFSSLEMSEAFMIMCAGSMCVTDIIDDYDSVGKYLNVKSRKKSFLILFM